MSYILISEGALHSGNGTPPKQNNQQPVAVCVGCFIETGRIIHCTTQQQYKPTLRCLLPNLPAFLEQHSRAALPLAVQKQQQQQRSLTRRGINYFVRV